MSGMFDLMKRFTGRQRKDQADQKVFEDWIQNQMMGMF